MKNAWKGLVVGAAVGALIAVVIYLFRGGSEKLREVGQKMQDQAPGAAEWVKEQADKVADAGLADRAKEAAGHAREAAEHAREAAGHAKEAAREAAGHAKEAAREAAGHAKEAAAHATSKGRGVATESANGDRDAAAANS